MAGELDLHLDAAAADGVRLDHGVVAVEEEADLARGGERTLPDEREGLLAAGRGLGVDGGEVEPVALGVAEPLDVVAVDGAAAGRRGAVADLTVDEPVGAGAADELVPPEAPFEPVVAAAAQQRVAAEIADEAVGAAVADEGVARVPSPRRSRSS